MKKAVIILPTYNEKGNIEKIISVLEDTIFPKIDKWKMAILVVDDSSPDGTAAIVTDLMKKYKNLDLLVGKKQGLGTAYIRGMTYAVEKLEADVMFEMDSDGQHDVNKIPQFLQKIDEGYDFVIGTRYSDGGSIPKGWGIHRKFLSVFGNIIIRTILMRFFIHDWTGGYRAITKEVFLKEKVKLKNFTGYTFQVGSLLNAVQDGFTIAEVPFHFGERTLGSSKIPGIKTIIDTFYYVVIARIKELLFGKFGKFLVVGGVGFVVNAITLELLVKFGNWHPAGANLVGASFAIFSNYNFNNLWTFKEHKSTTLASYFTRLISFYASSSFGVIFIQTGTIFLGTHFISEKYYFLYFIVGTGFLLIWNYFMYSKFIWKKKPQ